MKNKYICIFLFCLTLPVTLGYLYLSKKNSELNDINCYGQIQYDFLENGHRDVLNAAVMYALADGTGIISYSGVFKYKGQSYFIKRNAQLDYKVKDRNAFFITSKKVNIENTDTLPDDLANLFLYSYIRKEGGWLSVSIKENGHNGYLISTTTVPQFFCKKT